MTPMPEPDPQPPVPPTSALAGGANAARATRDAVLRDIERTMTREPRDRVRCVHLFDNYFRCNWWAPIPAGPDSSRAFEWSTRSTHHVRKSQFLRVTASAGRLVIEEVDTRVASR